jgi:hypothetical protein
MSSSSKFIINQLYGIIIQKHKLYQGYYNTELILFILLLALPESSTKHKNLLIYAAAEKLKQLKWLKNAHYLFSLFLIVGGSIGGTAIGVRMVDFGGGTTGAAAAAAADRTETAGLPADDERTDWVCSTKFRPN